MTKGSGRSWGLGNCEQELFYEKSLLIAKQKRWRKMQVTVDMMAVVWGNWWHCRHCGRQTGGNSYTDSYLPQTLTSVTVISPIFKFNLPFTAKFFFKCPHRYSQRYEFSMTLKLVKMSMKIIIKQEHDVNRLKLPF